MVWVLDCRKARKSNEPVEMERVVLMVGVVLLLEDSKGRAAPALQWELVPDLNPGGAPLLV